MRHTTLKTTACILAITLMGTVLAAPASAGPLIPDDDVVEREAYVAGTSTADNAPVQHRQAHCTSTPAANVNVGGVCDVEIPTEVNLAILVDDLVLHRVPFHFVTHTADGDTTGCPAGHSVGETTFDAPPGCTQLDVYVAAPSAGGLITVKRDDAVVI